MSDIKFSKQSAIAIIDKDSPALAPCDSVYAKLAIGKDNHLLHEPMSFDDAENIMLAGCQTVEGHNAEQEESGLMLAAISTKFSPARLERTVKAFAKKLNTSLTGTGLETDGITIGKPRVAGGFATLVTQIKLSDGQAISMLFHAPDEDPAKFNQDDTLFAFMFRLNTKDVTNVVAPSGGMDISIGQATMVLSNLAEKNSGAFVARKTAQAEKKLEAEKLELELEELKVEGAKLAEEATGLETQKADLTEKLKTRKGMAAKQEGTITSLNAEIKLATPAKKEPESKLNPENPFDVTNDDSEGRYSGSQISFTTRGGESFTGKVIDIVNGGKLLNVNVDDMAAASLRVKSRDITSIDKLVDNEVGDKPAKKEPEKSVEKSLEAPFINYKDLASHYRFSGLSRQQAWDKYVTDTITSTIVKSDQVDAKEFLAAYDAIEGGYKSDKYPSVKADFEAKANDAATSTENDLTEPTEAQKLAGNYKKGKAKFQGLDVVIENPKGSTRSGVGADGEKWSTTMKSHYGDIVGTKGADGDKLDIFVGENHEAENAYIVDQTNQDGSFDEHKIMLGFDSKEKAKKGYLVNYDKDWQGLGNITEIAMEDLKKWIKGETVKPYRPISGVTEESAVAEEMPEVTLVTGDEWNEVRKDKNIKKISSTMGRFGADYEVIFKDLSSKFYKFSEEMTASNDDLRKPTQIRLAMAKTDFEKKLATLGAESETASKKVNDIAKKYKQGSDLISDEGKDDPEFKAADKEFKRIDVQLKAHIKTNKEAAADFSKRASNAYRAGITPEEAANIKEGVRFDDVTTSQGQIDLWDSMKKGDVVYSHLGRKVGAVVRKPTKTMDTVLLTLENERDAKIDSQKITGTSVKKLRKLNEKGQAANDLHLAQEKESKKGVKVEGDVFYQGGVDFEITMVDLDAQQAEITQGGYMTWVTNADSLTPDYGIVVKGLNDDGIDPEPDGGEDIPAEEAPASELSVSEQAKEITDKGTISAEDYKIIQANEELELALQDTLDSLFTRRLYEVVNHLRDSGWNKSGDDYIKGDTVLTKELRNIGAGANVSAVAYDLASRETNATYENFGGVKDDLTLTTEEIASKLNDFAKSVADDLIDEKVSAKAIADLEGDLEPLINSMLDELTESIPASRLKLSDDFKRQLYDYSKSVSDIPFNTVDKERSLFVGYAAQSLFLDTALNELQNGGFIPLDVNLKDLQDREPTPQTIEEYLDGGGEGEYNAQAAYDDVLKLAKEFDIDVNAHIGKDLEDGGYDVLMVDLAKNDKKATMQIMGGNAKAAMFINGNRAGQFGNNAFFELYSEDPDTRRERMEAFSLWASPEEAATPAKPEASPTNDAYRKLEQLNRGLVRDMASSLSTIKGIDDGTAQGYERSLFVNSITGKIKTQHRQGNQTVVDAALDYIEAFQSERMNKPAITTRNGVWKLRSFDEPEAEEVPVQEEAPKSALDKKFDLAEQMGGANYWYGFMMRPPSLGAIPKANTTIMLDNEEARLIFDAVQDKRSIRHGAVGYAEKLSGADIKSFELVELNFESKSEQREEAGVNREEIIERVIDNMKADAESDGLTIVDYIESQSSNNIKNALGKILRHFPEFDEEDDHPDYLVLEDVLENTTWEELSVVAESLEQQPSNDTAIAGGDSEQASVLTNRAQALIDNPPADSDSFDQVLDTLASDIEDAGLMESLEPKLNEAADLLSELLELEAE